jgi:hypothetical protein
MLAQQVLQEQQELILQFPVPWVQQVLQVPRVLQVPPVHKEVLVEPASTTPLILQLPIPTPVLGEFGLTQAPSTLQRLCTSTMKPMVQLIFSSSSAQLMTQQARSRVTFAFTPRMTQITLLFWQFRGTLLKLLVILKFQFLM